MRHELLVATVLCSVLGVAFHERPARACGGCFHGPSPTPERESVVTDHRMVFSISRTQTVLWDQIRYTGDPGEFAWVLPVRAGARVELSNDAWMAALEASTQPVVLSPQVSCRPTGGTGGGGPYGSTSGGSYGGGGGGGGGCLGASSDQSLSAEGTSYSDGGASFGGADSGAAGFQGNDQVSVVNQTVIGPYETVTVHASSGQGLEDWLVGNGFAVPPELVPTIQDYTKEGFDFIALKLRPGAGIRAMQPVRVVSPGADPSMPLRMVAAGIGAHVGITLFVLGEGRYHTQNFPDATYSEGALTWDPLASRSNYAELTMAALQGGDGRGFLTELAGQPALDKFTQIGRYNPGLAAAYYQQCERSPPVRVPCAVDAGPPGDAGHGSGDGGNDGGDAGGGDAGPSDAAVDAVATDAAPPPPEDAGCFVYENACKALDDLDVALAGMHASDVWVTRLRAYLPASSLAAGDLRLEASPVQAPMPSVRTAAGWNDPSYSPCARGASQSTPQADTHTTSAPQDSGCECTTTGGEKNALGTYALIGATFLLTGSIVRRRRKSR